MPPMGGCRGADVLGSAPGSEHLFRGHPDANASAGDGRHVRIVPVWVIGDQARHRGSTGLTGGDPQNCVETSGRLLLGLCGMGPFETLDCNPTSPIQPDLAISVPAPGA